MVGLAGSLCLVSLPLYDFGSFFMVVVMDSKWWWWCAVGMVATVFFFFLWGLILGWVLTMVVVVGFDCCTGGDWLLGFDYCAGGGYCEELVFVVEFWWKVGCMGLLERETNRKREEREIEEKREKFFFYII